MHRHCFCLKGWIILVNDSYHCVAPLSGVSLAALTLVCSLRWMAWDTLLSQSPEESAAPVAVEPTAVQTGHRRPSYQVLGVLRERGVAAGREKELSDCSIDRGLGRPGSVKRKPSPLGMPANGVDVSACLVTRLGPSLVSDALCRLCSSCFMTLTSAEAFAERKEITPVLVCAIAGYFLAKENAMNNMCHLEKSLSVNMCLWTPIACITIIIRHPERSTLVLLSVC